MVLEIPPIHRMVGGQKEDLILPRNPGTGKTMIASIAVNHLELFQTTGRVKDFYIVSTRDRTIRKLTICSLLYLDS